MTKERSGGEPEWEPNGAGIMRVMMSRGATGCQADRARRVALELGTGGGQSIPAALAAYLNVAFRSMLTRWGVQQPAQRAASTADPLIVGREAEGVGRGV